MTCLEGWDREAGWCRAQSLQRGGGVSVQVKGGFMVVCGGCVQVFRSEKKRLCVRWDAGECVDFVDS